MRSVANRVSRAWADLFSPQEKKPGPQLVSPPALTEPTPAPGAGCTCSPRKSTSDPHRCQFYFADGRRCRTSHCDEHPTLCLRHARAHLKLAQAVDLAPLSGEFTTATEINRALGKVFLLLAQNRIPRRNAVALGYLAQLMLQTLPGVREEITTCLGHKAWDKTIEDALRADDDEDEAENATSEANSESDRHEGLGAAPCGVQGAGFDFPLNVSATAVLAQEQARTEAPVSASEAEQKPPKPKTAHEPNPQKSPEPVATSSTPDMMVVRGTHISPDGKTISNSTYSAPGPFPTNPVVAKRAQPAPIAARATNSKSREAESIPEPQLFRNEHLQKNRGRGSTNLLTPNRKQRGIWCGSGSPFRRPR